MQDQRIVICSGGALGDWAFETIRSADLLVGADAGALFLIQNGFRPDIAMGDFDSVTSEELKLIERESRELVSCDPIHKDLTDTEMAFNWSLMRKPKEIILLGALGTRFDHSLANIHLLLRGLQANIRSLIIDRNNEVMLTDSSTTVHKGRYSNVSLLPLSEVVTGITLEGFLYPLHDASLTIGQSLGISNVLLKDQGVVTVRTGQLLIIQSLD